jgi:O-antigen ligase
MRRLAYVVLWLLVFLVPAEDTVSLGGVTLLRLVGIAGFVIGLFAVLPDGRVRPLRPVHAWMLLFTITAAASYFWSQAPDITLSRIFTCLQFLGMTWLIWEFCPEEERQLGLLRAYVAGSVVSALGTIAQYVRHGSIPHAGAGRFGAGGFDPNDLAVALALCVPIAWYLCVKDRRWLARLIYGATMPVIFFAIALTASRGGVLALLSGLLFVPLSSAKLKLSRVIASILVLLACTYAIARLVPAASRERLSTTIAEVAHGTMDGRRRIWREALAYAGNHLFMGTGAGAFVEVSSLGVVHDTYLSVLVEEGIIGFVFFCGILIILLRMAIGMPPLERNLWLILLLTWGVGAASLTWEYHKTTWFIFAMAAAQAALHGAQERATNAPVFESCDDTDDLHHGCEGNGLPASQPGSDVS